MKNVWIELAGVRRGQREREHAALAVTAGQHDVAAVQLQDAPHDHQAQPAGAATGG